MFTLKQICFFHCDFTDGWKRTILSYSCFDVPAVISLSSAQTRDHFTRVYIYLVHQWNPVKAFYGCDSSSPSPRQHHKGEREREKTLFFHLYSQRSCSTRVTAGEMFLSILVRLAGTLKRVSSTLCCILMASTLAAIFVLHFQFILRFDRTTARRGHFLFFIFITLTW